MAKTREELVGKRFLSVSGSSKLKLSKITDWDWRAGVIRACTHTDSKNHDLQVRVRMCMCTYVCVRDVLALCLAVLGGGQRGGLRSILLLILFLFHVIYLFIFMFFYAFIYL